MTNAHEFYGDDGNVRLVDERGQPVPIPAG